jgi:DNA-binding NtrC family response regulator
MKNKIVIIDDEVKLLKALKRALEMDGHEVFDFSNPDDGLEFLQNRGADLAISDIRMAGMTGIELLRKVGESNPEIPFILMTAFSSVETAVTAVKLGAKDYLLKPFEISELKEAVSNILESQKSLDKENLSLTNGLIGESSEMKAVKKLINDISDTDSTVLVTGESGTGKELVARAIHDSSLRKNNKFVAVNCSAIPDALFESEMFGHKKGSFTNAYSDKAGLFNEAEGGTLFLDEIGDLTLPNQAKLLRVLQDGIFKPVGATGELNSNVRIISATNKNLKEEVKNSKFREDLLYRINVVEIDLPPLRKRKKDIVALVNFFIKRYSKKHNRKIDGATQDLFELFYEYIWPGNVRQLENCIERAVILKKIGLLTSEDVNLPRESERDFDLSSDQPLMDTIGKIEETIIVQALETAKWNYSRAASILGVTRQNLHYKLKKYGISKEN